MDFIIRFVSRSKWNLRMSYIQFLQAIFTSQHFENGATYVPNKYAY